MNIVAKKYMRGKSSTDTRSVFRPLIASSLALALEVSVGYAQADGTSWWYANGSTQDGPYAYITYGSQGSDPWSGNLSSDNNIVALTLSGRIQNKVFNLNAKDTTIKIASDKMIDFSGATGTLNLTNSYLKFENQSGTNMREHFLRSLDGSANLVATFNGGGGTETIGSTTWNNVAFYGAIVHAKNNDKINAVKFQSGANMIGQIRLAASAATTTANYTFSGGGNLIAMQDNYYMNSNTNIKDQAVFLTIGTGSSSKVNDLTLNIVFGETDKVEVVDNDSSILDTNGVIGTLTIPATVSRIDTSNINNQVNKTIITNMIRGNLYAEGYSATYVQKSVGNINFNNNGIIDGNVLVGSYGQFNVSFAQNGKITGLVKATGTGENVIKFNNDNSSSTAEISSGVIALNSASNNVVAKNNLTIGAISNSEGIGNWSIYTHNNGGNRNTITVDHNLVVTSGIKSSYGTNTITADSLEIKTNGIYTTYGTNTITAASLTIDAGKLYATGNGNNAWAKNILVITNNMQVAGDIVSEQATSRNFITTGSINVGGQVFAQNGGTRNFIKITGTDTSSINTLKTNNGWNTISLESSGNLSITTTISTASSNARNYIAKGIAITPTDNSSSKELALSFNENNWLQTSYQASGKLTVAGDISATNGRNYINVTSFQANGEITTTSGQNNINANSLSVSGLVDANGGTNNLLSTNLSVANIRARWRGINNIIVSGSITSTFSGSITAGGTESTNTGNNCIYFADSAIANFSNISSLSAGNGLNYISLGNATANNLSISTISVTGSGKNYLAKNILSNSNGNLTAQTLSNGWWASDTNAFEGSLSIGGVNNTGSGANYISYKATNSATSAIISNLVTSDDGSKTLGTAVSGSNNSIYLNVSSSSIHSAIGAMTNANYQNSSVIIGHIASSGTTNIKIVGTPNTTARVATDMAQIGILGNIINTNGNTNIILQDSLLAPSAIITNQNGVTQAIPVGGNHAGNITTASGATTNLVTRFTNPVVTSSGVSMYNINSAGTTNVVIQGNVNVGTNIEYYKGSAINLIFASENNNSDSFEGNYNSLTSNGSMVLGSTYQDGVKLSIADKTVMIGDKTASFLDTYSSYYSDGSTPLATVSTDRTSGNTDVITIHGLVVGNIYSLANGKTSKAYNVTLESGSAFAGNIALDAGTTTAITMTMNNNSKLILADSSDENSANNFVISTLKIAGGEVDQYQLQTETLKQTNNVINIATGGAGANNVATRTNFRLLTIGNANTNNGSSIANANTGLQGDGAAVFMTYVNTNATDQNNVYIGGKQGETGGLGNAYSDRIIIANIGDNQKAQTGTYYMQFAVDADSKLGSVKYDASNDSQASGGGTKTAGNIAVLTVVNTQDKIDANEENKAGITLKTQDVLQGFDRIGGDLIAVETDITGEAGNGKQDIQPTSSMLSTLVEQLKLLKMLQPQLLLQTMTCILQTSTLLIREWES